jgi:hypothetical protein
MKYAIFALLVGALRLQDAVGGSPTSDEVRLVSVKGPSVCTRIGRNAPPVCFAYGSGNKHSPAWSSNGERIAFIEDTDPKLPMLARLLIIDRHGQLIHSLPIKEVGPNQIQAGWRYIASVEWVGSSRVAISGSMNPSSREYLVYDAASGLLESEFGNDGPGAVFNPRTGEPTNFTDAPHFSFPEPPSPKLVVGGKEVLDLALLGLSVTNQPKWSPDGRTLVIPVESTGEARAGATAPAVPAGKASLLVFNLQRAKAAVVALPPGVPVRFSVFWDRDTIIIGEDLESPKPAQPAAPGRAATVHEAWQISLADATAARAVSWKRVAAEKVTAPEVQAARVKSALRKELFAPNAAHYGDIWCGACVAAAPRR